MSWHDDFWGGRPYEERDWEAEYEAMLEKGDLEYEMEREEQDYERH